MSRRAEALSMQTSAIEGKARCLWALSMQTSAYRAWGAAPKHCQLSGCVNVDVMT